MHLLLSKIQTENESQRIDLLVYIFDAVKDTN